jgi:hypothetical protein
MVSSIQGMGPMQGMDGMMGMRGMRPQEKLTDEQKQKVQDILSKYDTDSLTSSDAKSIFKAFEDAGIKGPGLRDAIEETGVEADELWSKGHDGQKPPQGGPGQAGGNQINASALQSLQDILSQFDLNNLSSKDQNTLVSQLQQAGLLQSGSMIDIAA